MHDPDAIIQDGDFERAELEAAGARYSHMSRLSAAAARSGDLAKAARLCPHGGGYPLGSMAATSAHDPRAGQAGWRCSNCGSVLDGEPWGREPRVIHPCERF